MSAPTSPLQGVLFDMGDILYDATAWRRWAAEHLASQGIDIDYPRLVEGWEAALVPVYLGTTDYWQALSQFVLGLGLPEDQLEDFLTLARNQGKQLSQSHKPFDGIAEGLARLKQHGLRLAILSDNESTSSKIQGKLKRFEIDAYFDAVLSSIDIKAVKPMPEAFDAAIDALQITRETAGFVAHDVDELEGSLAHGLYTVAFNYTPGAPADFHAKDFAEAVDALIRAAG